MPDHIRLLLQDRDVVDFVRLLKGKLAPLARRLEPDRARWQRSFYDHALRREETLSDVARYIWHNLVRAGLVMRAREYPWSGSLVWPDWTTMLEGGSGESGRG
jgi:REP element-mobilizing transposase RayT